MPAIPITFRPITLWPGEVTRNRKASPFQSSWPSTLDLLDRELHQLRARDVVLEIALSEWDIRQDGWPRANARNPDHPGVILAFNSRVGPLKYQTDIFNHWRANVRAIALALEALRKVDRYGITKRGEQYAGWKALPSPAEAIRARGERLIEEHGSVVAALHATHPDHGGDPEDFHAVQEARKR